MTDKEFNSIKSKIAKSIKYWAVSLGLSHWDSIDFLCHRDSHEMDIGASDCSVAAISCDWTYRHALIKFNVQRMKEFSKQEIDAVVVHELSHCLVNQMRELLSMEENDPWIKHEESTVTGIAIAVLGACDRSFQEGYKQCQKDMASKI